MAFDFKKIIHDCKDLKNAVNVGQKDQQIRYWAGGAALLLSVYLGNVFLLIVGIVLVASAYFRWCPAYSAMSKNSLESCCCHAEKKESGPCPESGKTESASSEAPAASGEAEEHAPDKKPRAHRPKQH
jgi:hypothetical protein